MVANFTGRDKETNELTTRVSDPSTRLFSIWGSGGFGKTSLAIAIGHQLHKQGITTCFVPLNGVDSVERLHQKLLNLTTDGCSSKQSQNQNVCACMRGITRDTVLILDNVDSLIPKCGNTKGEFTQTLQEYLMASSKLNIICTSREYMNYAAFKHKMSDFRIGTLQPADSQHLLKELTGTISDCSEQDYSKLSKVCGHAPLGICLMARLITEDKILPKQIITDLKNSNILTILDSEDLLEEERLQEIIRFSYSKLSLESRINFVSISVFPGSFDAEAAAAVLNNKEITHIKKQLGVLVRKSLLEYDSILERYHFHTLIHAFTEHIVESTTEMKIVKDKFRVRHHQHFLQYMATLNEEFLTGQSLKAVQCFRQNVDSLLFCILDSVSCYQTNRQVSELLIDMEIFLAAIMFDDSKLYNKIMKKHKESCHEDIGSRSELNAKLLISEAFGCLHWPSSEADRLLSEAKDIIGRNFSVPSPLKGKFLCYLGLRSLILCQKEKGIAQLEEGVSLLTKSTTQNIVIKLISLRVLVDYYKMEKDHVKTERKLRYAQSLCRPFQNMEFILAEELPKNRSENMTGNQPLAAEILYFLSQFCTLTTNMENILLHATMELDLQHENEDNELDVAEGYEKYGSSFLSIGSNSNALTSFQTALDIKLKLLGEENENTALSYKSLGETHYRLADYNSALNCHKHALDIRLKLLGEDNENTASSYNELGIAHYHLGDYSSALNCHKHALDTRLKVFGEDNENTASSYHNLGGTHYRLDDYNSALNCHKHALDIRLKILGEDNEDTAFSYQNLGVIHYQLGDYSSALNCHKHALDIRLKLLGEDNENTASSYNELGMTHYHLGDYSSALNCHKHALDTRLKVFGEDNENTALSYHNLGVTHYHLGDYNSALNCLKHALDIRLKLFGEDNENTASSYKYLGRLQECIKLSQTSQRIKT